MFGVNENKIQPTAAHRIGPARRRFVRKADFGAKWMNSWRQLQFAETNVRAGAVGSSAVPHSPEIARFYFEKRRIRILDTRIEKCFLFAPFLARRLDFIAQRRSAAIGEARPCFIPLLRSVAIHIDIRAV